MIVYLCGPYRAPNGEGIDRNIEIAKAEAKRVWRSGYVALCPHLNTAHFDGMLPDQVFLDGDIELLKRCDCVLTFGKWAESNGVRHELEAAAKAGIRVYHSIADLDRATKGKA